MKIAETCLISYPRSGSKWLRFIVCNAFYPLDEGHDFGTIDYYFPRDEMGTLSRSISPCKFFATHLKLPTVTGLAEQFVYLHRHVGDVLISNYHFHKHSVDYRGTIEEYIEEKNYGKGWREHVESIAEKRSEILHVPYEQLNSPIHVVAMLAYLGCRSFKVEDVMVKSSFEAMVEADNGNREYIRKGTSGQWKEISEPLQSKILEKNKDHLKALEYV